MTIRTTMKVHECQLKSNYIRSVAERRIPLAALPHRIAAAFRQMGWFMPLPRNPRARHQQTRRRIRSREETARKKDRRRHTFGSSKNLVGTPGTVINHGTHRRPHSRDTEGSTKETFGQLADIRQPPGLVVFRQSNAWWLGSRLLRALICCVAERRNPLSDGTTRATQPPTAVTCVKQASQGFRRSATDIRSARAESDKSGAREGVELE